MYGHCEWPDTVIQDPMCTRYAPKYTVEYSTPAGTVLTQHRHRIGYHTVASHLTSNRAL